MSTLEERLEGAGAKPWIPDPAKAAKYEGESIQQNPLIGVFVDHSTRLNFRQDGYYDVVTLMVDGVGEVAVHCQATALANQMHQARPVFGERVGVKYLGERKSAGGADYSDYTVRVDRARQGGEVRWADGKTPTAPAPAPPPPSPPAPAGTSPVAQTGDAPLGPTPQGGVATQDDGIPFGPVTI